MVLRTTLPSTNDDSLRMEAVNLATDATSLLVSCREIVNPVHAYTVAMECARIADRIQRGRNEALPRKGARYFREAGLAAVRAMTALDLTGARSPLLRRADPEVEGIHRRLSALAIALGVQCGKPEGNAAA